MTNQTAIKQPPETVPMFFCPICGQHSFYRPPELRHGTEGKLCGGKLITVTYRPELFTAKAAVETDAEYFARQEYSVCQLCNKPSPHGNEHLECMRNENARSDWVSEQTAKRKTGVAV